MKRLTILMKQRPEDNEVIKCEGVTHFEADNHGNVTVEIGDNYTERFERMAYVEIRGQS